MRKLLVLALALLTLTLAACGGDEEEAAPPADTAATTETGEAPPDLSGILQEAGVLTVGAEPPAPPFIIPPYPDNPSGFEVDIAEEIGRRLGLETKLRPRHREPGLLPGCRRHPRGRAARADLPAAAEPAHPAVSAADHRGGEAVARGATPRLHPVSLRPTYPTLSLSWRSKAKTQPGRHSRRGASPGRGSRSPGRARTAPQSSGSAEGGLRVTDGRPSYWLHWVRERLERRE
jgi:hypothetical protein